MLKNDPEKAAELDREFLDSEEEVPEDDGGSDAPSDDSDLFWIYDYPIDKQGIWSEFPPHHGMYIAFTVVVDMDREVLTVDGDMHYDLFDIPEDWRDLPEDKNTIKASRMKFAYHPAPPDEELLKLYDSAKIDVNDDVPAQRPTDIRRAIMNDMIRNYMDTYRFPFREYQHEWGPLDIQFQRLVYALVKLASWNQFGFRHLDEEEYYELDEEFDTGEFLQGCRVPAAETYCIPGGAGEVLIHLNTHLDQDIRSAIGRVIKFTQESGKSYVSACIISLVHVITVHVVIEDGKVVVKHTSPTPLNRPAGRDLLITTLYPVDTSCHSDFYTVTANLPAEVIENIFKHLFLTPDGATTIPSWRLVCRAFDDLVRTRVLSLPNLTILDYADFNDHKRYHGVDGTGEVGIWTRGCLFCVGKREYRWCATPRGEAKWASLGCGVLTLWEVDPGRDESEDSVISSISSEHSERSDDQWISDDGSRSEDEFTDKEI